MILSLIAAMAEDGCIGFHNRLPWHLPEDLKRFKEITLGHPVIMGRKTYDSMGKLLPGRKNFIITRNPNLSIEGAEICRDLGEALEKASREDVEVYVIGGSEIFREAMPLADRLYLTIIHGKFEGDTYFPDLDWEKNFSVTEKSRHQSEGAQGLEYTFITAVRRTK